MDLHRTRRSLWIRAAVFAAGVAVLVASLVLNKGRPEVGTWLGFVAGMLLALFGGSALASRLRPVRIRLDRDGIRVHSGRLRADLPWTDIERVTFDGITHSPDYLTVWLTSTAVLPGEPDYISDGRCAYLIAPLEELVESPEEIASAVLRLNPPSTRR